MTRDEAIQYAKDKLADVAFHDYELIAFILRDEIDVDVDHDLWILAYLLSSGEYGCSRNDVIGLLELMESDKKEVNNVSRTSL
jgi:hypothetical protein